MSEPRPAATIILAREAEPDYEVLMLRRHKDLAFAGGAYVFPGGSVDESDRSWSDRVDGTTQEALASRLGTPDALGFAVAAVREAFEESGILLGRADGSGVLARGAALVGPEVVRARERLLAGEADFAELVDELGVTLELASLRYIAHWVTPVGVPRRFDTRFFLARVPGPSVAAPDTMEVVAAEWIRPEEALRRARAGDFQLVAPTAKNLERLVGFSDLDALFAGLGDLPVPRIEPRLYRDAEGVVRVALPGDPRYETARAELAEGESLPGPGEEHDGRVDGG